MTEAIVALAIAAATLMGQPPGVFCRLVGEESNWDEKAVSPSGAVGLSQIMQEPWRWHPEDPFDPAANLGKGAWILAWNHNYRLERGVTGREAMMQAVASYNLGHGKVNKLLRKHGDGWLEALPERVRQYVETVVGDYGLVDEAAKGAATEEIAETGRRNG